VRFVKYHPAQKEVPAVFQQSLVRNGRPYVGLEKMTVAIHESWANDFVSRINDCGGWSCCNVRFNLCYGVVFDEHVKHWECRILARVE
jgi:hypothetical protein